MLNKLKKQSGMTLIEMIVYIGVVSLVMTIVVQFSWNILETGVRVDVSSELTQNGRLVLEKFTQKVRQAEDITISSSTFGSHPGVLALDMPGSDDIIFDTYTKSVTVGGQNLTIRKLRMQTGVASPIDITSDNIDITNFYLQNFTRNGKGKNINLQLTIDNVDTGQDPIRDHSISLETGVTLREQ